MRILLTGAKGQLSHCLKDCLPDDWELISTDSHSLDITDEQAVINMTKGFQPDAIINTAAASHLNHTDTAQQHIFAVNAQAVRNLAAAAANIGARFIHISTDNVFDGQQQRPYRESDAPNPQNLIGQSKLAGELLALSTNPDSLIIRTSWLFSEYGNNFVQTVLKEAAQQDSLSASATQIGNPTYAGDLAQVIFHLLRLNPAPRGIYHFTGAPSVSRYDFTETIIQTASEKISGFKTPLVQASENTKAAHYATFGALDCSKIFQDFGILPSDWQEALNKIIAK